MTHSSRFDVVDYLKAPEDRLAYIEAVFEDGDPSLIAHALDDVARAVGMTSVAGEESVTLEALYKALSGSTSDSGGNRRR